MALNAAVQSQRQTVEHCQRELHALQLTHQRSLDEAFARVVAAEAHARSLSLTLQQ